MGQSGLDTNEAARQKAQQQTDSINVKAKELDNEKIKKAIQIARKINNESAARRTAQQINDKMLKGQEGTALPVVAPWNDPLAIQHYGKTSYGYGSEGTMMRDNAGNVYWRDIESKAPLAEPIVTYGYGAARSPYAIDDEAGLQPAWLKNTQ
ncbi:MAG: hypothetical protein LUC37_04835 [Prevotella sp.]|nr:hypothetical protein [Prevotella sp.]